MNDDIEMNGSRYAVILIGDDELGLVVVRAEETRLVSKENWVLQS